MYLRLFALLLVTAFVLFALGELPQTKSVDSSRGLGHSVEFEPPEMVFDGSELGGRLHPHYADFDGDEKIDRLLGVENRLVIYRNRGTNARPEYAKPVWFDEMVPSGRIPDG